MTNKRKLRPLAAWWIAVASIAMFGVSPPARAMQHEPAPPVQGSTVDQPSSVRVEGAQPEQIEGEQPGGQVQGEQPEKSTEGVMPESREKPKPPSRDETRPCGETVSEIASGPHETEVVYKLNTLFHHPDEYMGKTITVDGEMHRQFTDKVFTIEGSGMFHDRDMLVISLVPMSESVVPLQNSFERGKNVRVTGVVRPYDRAKLECLFGPLRLESREGHSFTKNPVLIIGYKAPAAPAVSSAPMQPERPSPSPSEPEQTAQAAPPSAPTPAAPEPSAPPPQSTERQLPRTAGNSAWAALCGLLFLLAGAAVRARRWNSLHQHAKIRSRG